MIGRRLRLATGALLPAVGLLGGGFWLSRRLAAPPVATFEVRLGRFVREVRGEGTLKSVRATPIVAPPSGRPQRVAYLARDGAPVKAGEVVVRFDPWESERDSADGKADRRAAVGKMDKTRAQGETTRRGRQLDRALAEDELDRARAFAPADEGIFSRHEIIESELDRGLYEKKVEALSGMLAAGDQLSRTDLALAGIEAGKADLRIREAEKGLKALEIAAPHDGLLVLERGWTGEPAHVGDTLWPGQKVAEIPEMEHLEARVYVLEADAAGLKPGLSALVSIEGRTEPAVAATVSRVEPIARPRTPQSPVKYFEAILALERTEPAYMRPGQRVQVVVQLEARDGVLAVPRAALFEKDGRRLVYRAAGRRFAPVEVTLGTGSAARVVVESGLQAGDRVALRDPAERASRIFAQAPGGAAAAAASRP
jgi:HlyD family secretion protein